MQDALAGRLLPHAGMETFDRAAPQFLRKAGSATENDPVKLREAAKEFEALFLSQMLKVMRETVEESGLTDKGPGQDVYTELFDTELARTLAGRGALGIADLLEKKLSERTQADGQGGEPPAAQAPPVRARTGTGGEVGDIPEFRMPVHAHISSNYGVRRDPFTHELHMHKGVDIAAPEGASVHAAAAGRVIFSGYENGYGNTVVVQHPDGFETRYAHLGAVAVNAGDQLQARQVLGTVGNTGRSTGPHVHFEVRHNGGQVDPKQLAAE